MILSGKLLLLVGIVLMVAAALIALFVFIRFSWQSKKLKKQLDLEYGPVFHSRTGIETHSLNAQPETK